MNLLLYKNRFQDKTNPDETNGYIFAMQDLLKYIEELTEFNPSKRMIDSVDITTAIGDTTIALRGLLTVEQGRLQSLSNKITGVQLSGYKVDEFLKEQINDSDTEKEITKEMKDYDDLKDINI